MATDTELLIKINGDAKQFQDEIDRVNAKTKNLQKSLRTVAKASTIAFVALAGAVGASVAKFAAFEKTFTSVQTLLDNGSFKTKTLTKGINDLRSGVIALGARTGESFDVLNQGLFDLVSGGVAADEALETLAVAQKLAAAGATDTATAVNALIASMTSFGEEAGTAQEIAEKFFTAQKFGVTTVGELANEFNKVGSTAKTLGLSFDETLASLSSLTADGKTKTAEAATKLKAAFNSIILVQSKLKNETEGVRDALSLQNVKSRGLKKSLELLNEATGGSIVENQRLLGSAEALAVINSLTGSQNALLTKTVNELSDAQKRAATFEEALNIKRQTTQASLNRLNRSVEAAAITFGELFAPSINAVADALSSMAASFQDIDKETLKSIATGTKWILLINGTIAVLAFAALGYLKLSAALTAAQFAIANSTIVTKIYSVATRVAGFATRAFTGWVRLATLGVRGFAAATGIGLVLVALSLMVTNFREVKAVGAGAIAAIQKSIEILGKEGGKILSALGDLISGIFTGNISKIGQAGAALKKAFTKSFTDVGKESAKAFDDAFFKSLAETDAAEKEAAGGGAGGGAASPVKKKAEEDIKIEADKIARIAAMKREQEELEKELGRALTEEEIKNLQTDLDLKQEIKKEDDERLIKRKSAERKQFLKDEMKLGTELATFKQFLNSEEVQATKQVSGQLVGLTRSKNSTLKGIGKAAAITQIAINTASGAIAAYQAMAGIPFVGPALGVIAAGALTAFGLERAGEVSSAAQGGFVPNSGGGLRDRTQMLLEPGELVVPRAIAPSFIEAAGRPDAGVGGGSGSSMHVEVGFRDEAFEIIEQKLLERNRIGIGGE